jgi:phosphorylcholine metabolism protein LicD
LDSWEFDQQRRWEIKSCVMEMFKDVPGNKYWMSFDYTTQKTHIFRDDTIFPLQELEFNGRKMKCPHDINKYLSYLYGDDYMKPVVKEMWIENLEIDGEKLI